MIAYFSKHSIVLFSCQFRDAIKHLNLEQGRWTGGSLSFQAALICDLLYYYNEPRTDVYTIKKSSLFEYA